VLEDDRTVGEYGIQDESILDVVLRLHGSKQSFANAFTGDEAALAIQASDFLPGKVLSNRVGHVLVLWLRYL
jgi:hypothetical protein